MNDLELADYVTLVITIPENLADKMREIIGKAGAGLYKNYSFCTFSTKGIGRFVPSEKAHPYIGSSGIQESVVEEKIETVCLVKDLEKVLEAIKAAHPYESTIIEIYPIYKIGCK